MQGRDIYAQIFAICSPGSVVDVTIDPMQQGVVIRVEAAADAALQCMACGMQCLRYDTRWRRWRHLNICQYNAFYVAEVPRVNCLECGAQRGGVPWPEPNSRFTRLIKAMTIN